MADNTAVFTLGLPVAADILFNNGSLGDGSDIFWITGDLPGLDGAPRRTPIDNRPQVHGGLVHPFFKGPRPFMVEGLLLIQSTSIGNSVRVIRNAMEETLRAGLDEIIQADGTWQWTPAGLGSRTLTVRNNVEVNIIGREFKTFTFGLVAANPDWS